MWSKRASVKSGVEELVGPAVVMGMGLRAAWGDGWENPNCVFIEGVGGWDFFLIFFLTVFFLFLFFWEDRGVGRLLWKIKDILRNVLRAT